MNGWGEKAEGEGSVTRKGRRWRKKKGKKREVGEEEEEVGRGRSGR